MRTIKVDLPTGDSVTFCEGQNGVRDIDDYVDEHTRIEEVFVTFDPQQDGDEEYGEPRIRLSKRLVTEL